MYGPDADKTLSFGLHARDIITFFKSQQTNNMEFIELKKKTVQRDEKKNRVIN